MKFLIKDKPTNDWLSSEFWKTAKLTSGLLIAMTLHVSAATESKNASFFSKLNSTSIKGNSSTESILPISEMTKISFLAAEQKTIKGKVTGTKGEPLPGVNVILK